jgi:hypothetical protein
MWLVRSPEAWTVAYMLIHAIERNAFAVLVDRQGRIAISHTGVVGLLIFEANIDRTPSRIGVRAAYFAHKCEFVLISLRAVSEAPASQSLAVEVLLVGASDTQT